MENGEITRHFRPSSDQPREGYAAIGDIRGWCGHVHTSLERAVECRERDRRDCQSTGGYSDRHVYQWDGESLRVVPYQTRGGQIIVLS